MARMQFTQGVTTAQLPVFPIPVVAETAPASSDIEYDLGQVWVRKDTAQVYMLAQLSSGTASWTLAAPGASDVDTLTGDSGGAISPASGNITLAGGTNITSVGSGSTITHNLDAAISLATSVTSPLYTVAAATDLAITAASGQDVVVKMGDNAAANKVSFIDSDDAEVAAIDSNGNLTFVGLTFTGLLEADASATIETAGTTLNLGSDNSGDDVNLGVGTVARDIGIGDSAAAHTITIGSTTGAASLDLLAGSGNFTINGAAATTYNIGAAATTGTVTIGGTSQTGNFVLGPSDGAMTMNIANDDGAKTINIGAGVDGNTISIGNGANTSAQVLNIAAGASGADSTVNLLSGVGTAGTQTLNVLTGTRAGALNLATGAAAHVIAVGSASAGAVSVDTAAGISLDSATASNFTVTGAADLTLDSSAGSVNIAGGEAIADAVSIQAAAGGVDLDGALQVNIASSQAAADAVRIDASNAAGGIDVDDGGGGMAFDSLGAISLDAAAASNFSVSGAGIDLTLASASGSVPISAGEAVANAIGLQAAAGGIDVDGALQVNIASSQDAADAIRLSASAGGIDIDATGEAGQDIVMTNTGGSLELEATESVGDAIRIKASGAAGGIDLEAGTGGVSMNSGLTMNVVNKVAGDSPYTLLGSDYVVACDTSAGVITVTLPASPATGRVVYVVDEGGSAGANNITVSGNGKNIAGAGTIAGTDVIDSNYGTLMLVYNGTFWNAADVA